MKILVLGGCGFMGSEVTRDLARTSDFEQIVIADADLERAQALAMELGGDRVRAIRADAANEVALTETLRGFDVIANCTTYHFGLIVSRAAITAEKCSAALPMIAITMAPTKSSVNPKSASAGCRPPTSSSA